MSQETSVRKPPPYSDIVSRIRKGMVPQLEFAADRPIDEKDFENHQPNSLEALKFALNLSESQSLMDISQDSTLQKQILVPLLILCFENMSKVPWNDALVLLFPILLSFKKEKILLLNVYFIRSRNHIQLSYQVLSQLKRRIFLSDSLCQALVNFDKSDKLLRWCLLELRPKLEHKLWVQYPGAQQAFVVLINQVEPFFCQNVHVFLELRQKLNALLTDQFSSDGAVRTRILAIFASICGPLACGPHHHRHSLFATYCQ